MFMIFILSVLNVSNTHIHTWYIIYYCNWLCTGENFIRLFVFVLCLAPNVSCVLRLSILDCSSVFSNVKLTYEPGTAKPSGFLVGFVPFLLAIMLSVLLRCTDSDYFGIFKLFLYLILFTYLSKYYMLKLNLHIKH